MDGSLRYRCLQQLANTQHVQRIQHLQDRLNSLKEYDGANFCLWFHHRKASVITPTAILKNDLEYQMRGGLPPTPMQQVLLTLRFYATARVSNYYLLQGTTPSFELFCNIKGSSFHFQLISRDKQKLLQHSRISLCCWSNWLHPHENCLSR